MLPLVRDRSNSSSAEFLGTQRRIRPVILSVPPTQPTTPPDSEHLQPYSLNCPIWIGVVTGLQSRQVRSTRGWRYSAWPSPSSASSPGCPSCRTSRAARPPQSGPATSPAAPSSSFRSAVVSDVQKTVGPNPHPRCAAAL